MSMHFVMKRLNQLYEAGTAVPAGGEGSWDQTSKVRHQLPRPARDAALLFRVTPKPLSASRHSPLPLPGIQTPKSHILPNFLDLEIPQRGTL